MSVSSFMLWYQYTDDDGKHIESLFPETYDQARDIMTYLVCGFGAQVQLYQWDYENNYWIFLEE